MDPARHVENPLQIPAWRYPAEYGPQPPSFSRGTTTTLQKDSPAWFLSGTASIRGHETLAEHDVAEQCRVTLENMDRVLEEMGCPGRLTEGGPIGRQWTSKIYARRPEDVPAIQAALVSLGAAAFWERATVVRADICRATLAVEMEMTVF
jgi:chorismate lyase / 3-hydroxybenzoate synthase